MTKILRRPFILAALLCCVATARAEEATAGATAEPPRPLGAVRLSLLSGVPDLVGLSGALTALRPLEVEVGASWLVQLVSVYARGGLALALRDDRGAAGRGWTMHLGLFVGYRYMRVLDAFVLPDSGATPEAWYATVNTGFEAVYWFRPHLGLDFHATLGAMLPLGTPTLRSVIPVIPDARVAVGLAF